MYRADHNVELRQHFVVEVEAAVLEDVHFNARQDAEAVELLARLADAPRVGQGALFVHAVGDGDGFGVVGDGDVFVAARARRCRHLFDGVLAVAFGGVHLEVAADVGQLNQARQAPPGGRFHFAGAFPQLGWNPDQPELLVNFLLGAPGHPLAALEGCERVLVERPAFLPRDTPQLDVVGFGASEVH